MNFKNVRPLLIGGIIVALVVAVIFLGYVSFNASVSLAYARQQQQDDQEQIKLLQELLFQTGNGLSEEQFSQLLKKDLSEKHIIKQEGNQISIDGIILKFADNKLISVTSMNKP